MFGISVTWALGLGHVPLSIVDKLPYERYLELRRHNRGGISVALSVIDKTLYERHLNVKRHNRGGWHQRGSFSNCIRSVQRQVLGPVRSPVGKKPIDNWSTFLDYYPVTSDWFEDILVPGRRYAASVWAQRPELIWADLAVGSAQGRAPSVQGSAQPGMIEVKLGQIGLKWTQLG